MLPNGNFPFSRLAFPTSPSQITSINENDDNLLSIYNSLPQISQCKTEIKKVNSHITEQYPISTDIFSISPTSLFSSDDFYIEALREMNDRLKNQEKIDRSYLDCSIAKAMLKRYGYSKKDIKHTLSNLSEKAKERVNKDKYVSSVMKYIKEDNGKEDLNLIFLINYSLSINLVPKDRSNTIVRISLQ